MSGIAPGRLIGVDYGLRRVGIAVTDPERGMAFARPALQRKVGQAVKALVEELAALAKAEDAAGFVVGLPLALDGSDTETTRQVRNFARKLASTSGVPVELADERLTSTEAGAMLREAGLSARKAKNRLDSQAAVLILETYLAQHGTATP